MAQAWKKTVGLPAQTAEALGHFCAELRGGLGDTLQAILLYGSAAKGEYHERYSDLNVMIVLSQIDVSTLDQLSVWIQRARRDIRLETMLIQPHDFERSTDVFPIKFSDIQNYHVLLEGTDVVKDLKIEHQHLRLRCEQELKNQSLRLRAMYVQRAHRPAMLDTTLYHATTSFLISLNALLTLQEGKHYKTKAEIIKAGAAAFPVEASLLTKLLTLRSEEAAYDVEQVKEMYQQLMESVDKIADIVDRMDETK